MQEKPRGIRASSKLEPSILIHVETSKGVNSTIGKPWNVFSGFRTCFVRVWKPLTTILCLREAGRVVFWPTTCVRRVKHACTWSKHAYARARLRAKS